MRKKIRIIQMMPSISMGDAVSNDALALKNVLKELDYDTAIYAECIDCRFTDGDIKFCSELKKLSPKDIIIYHLAIGSDVNYKFQQLPGRKIIIYHNITPYQYFEGYNSSSCNLCREGIEQTKELAKTAEYCLADSEFNKQCLIELGYKCKIDVLPILIPFSDYEKQPNQKIVNRYGDKEYTNILFTGRIAPNKKHEEVIKTFYHYQKYYNNKARLFLVGSYQGMELYYRELKCFIKENHISNVYFTGHIPFDEILAYYRIADVFLCQSEHEGFCVPLVEAMYFDLPIVAYNSCAIPGTLGGSGILLNSKNSLEAAAMVDRLVRDETLRNKVLCSQRERLKDFAYDTIKEQFIEYLKEFIGDINER